MSVAVMLVIATVVAGAEKVPVLVEGVSAGAVDVIVSPKTEIMEEKEVIARTVVGIGGEGVESCSCCRGLRPRRFDVSPVIVKNGPYEPHSKRSIYFGLWARQKKNPAPLSSEPAVLSDKKSILVPFVGPVGSGPFGLVSIFWHSGLQITKKS